MYPLTKIGIIMLFTSMLLSCKDNSNGSKPENTSQKQNTPQTKITKESPAQIFFQAQGGEPGWQLTIHKKLDILNYTLELDYGDIQKQGVVNLKRLDHSNYAIFKLLNDNNETEIKLKMEACYDEADNKHQCSVTIQNNDKLYFGCGDFHLNTKLKDELKATNQIDHYICYSNNERKDKKIWVGFNKDDIALKVKYEGQDQAIELVYSKNEYKEGGAHPTINTYYDEIYRGEVNGVYKMTHSGIWDYVEYTRGKDGKTFKFTIEHELDPYGKQPCF